MRRATSFRTVISDGSRARSGVLVVHHRAAIVDAAIIEDHSADKGDPPAVVGLIVGKSVGGSVVRHRVSRRLRAQLAARLAVLPSGSGTVVRALPGASRADSAELGRDLDTALGRVVAGSRTR
jgi:ribonuclease P protein component